MDEDDHGHDFCRNPNNGIDHARAHRGQSRDDHDRKSRVHQAVKDLLACIRKIIYLSSNFVNQKPERCHYTDGKNFLTRDGKQWGPFDALHQDLSSAALPRVFLFAENRALTEDSQR